MSTRISSAYLKPFSDWVAPHVPQLGRRNRNVGWPQVVPLVMRRTKMWLDSNHRLIGIVREYWWGGMDRGGSCWRHRFVSSDEQVCFFFFLIKEKEIQFLFYMPHPIVCNGFKIHALCEHTEARAGSILFYHFLSRTLRLTSFQLLDKSGSWVRGWKWQIHFQRLLKRKSKNLNCRCLCFSLQCVSC